VDEHLNLVVLGASVLLLVALLAVRLATRPPLPVLRDYQARGRVVG
jgi:hypothetical protein